VQVTERETEVGEDMSGHAILGGASDAGAKEKKLTNQFNFSERASQTYNNPMRVSQFCLCW